MTACVREDNEGKWSSSHDIVYAHMLLLERNFTKFHMKNLLNISQVIKMFAKSYLGLDQNI